MQNCFEPVINEKQKQIDAFVEDALDSLEERIVRTAEGASDEYMAKLEEEEYARAISILTDIYAECSVMQCIKDALNKPDYIWDSTFIESIGKENVHKWYHSTLNGSIKDFKQDNTIYDEDNPYLSYIYKVVLYEKYALFLLGRIEQRKTLRSIDEKIRKQKDKAQMEVEIDAFIADIEKKLTEIKESDKKDEKQVESPKKDQKIAPPTTPPARPTFNHKLSDKQIEHLTAIVNDLHILVDYDDEQEKEITTEQMKAILNCNSKAKIKSKNNRLLVHMFDHLFRRDFISENWQAVIAKNHLFLTSQKNKYIEQGDLSSALNMLFKTEMGDKYNKLEVHIKNLQKY